jgi:two-component system, OmpR family, response regulator VicR
MKKILIVEDEKSLAQAYQTILEKNGYAVQLAYDGEEALELIEKGAVDLILLDINMPKMNGIEMLKQMDKEVLNNRVIVFSNQDSQADIDEAFRLGAKRYLLKSWASPQDLVKVVEEGLEA